MHNLVPLPGTQIMARIKQIAIFKKSDNFRRFTDRWDKEYQHHPVIPIPIECRNLSASKTTFRLENLQPESRYSISLAGATKVGPGPSANLTITTFPSKEPPGDNLPVWISLGLLVTFFWASILCSVLVKR